MIEPLDPNDVLSSIEENIPYEMIESINELILRNWKKNSSTFTRPELIELYLSKKGESNIEQNRINVYGFLNFEAVYEQKGWEVTFTPANSNNAFTPEYTFKKKIS